VRETPKVPFILEAAVLHNGFNELEKNKQVKCKHCYKNGGDLQGPRTIGSNLTNFSSAMLNHRENQNAESPSSLSLVAQFPRSPASPYHQTPSPTQASMRVAMATPQSHFAATVSQDVSYGPARHEMLLGHVTGPDYL